MKNIFERFMSVDPVDEKISELKLEIAQMDEKNETSEAKLELLGSLLDVRKADLDIKKQKSELHMGSIFSQINPNTVIQGVFGIVSIAMILEYEKTDVISSKSMNIAQKMLGK